MPGEVPSEMTAIEITAPGGPEVLAETRRPVPVPAAGDILIEVAVAGVNRPDVAQRAGLYPPPKDASDLPGLEVSGRVAARGVDVTRWQVGDLVTALTPGGGYAEYCTAPASNALPIPQGLSMLEAAALPETFFTVWNNVYLRGHLQAGETLLVHGGTSGIGTTAIQIARAFGSKVIATAGSDEKCQVCRDLGAETAINYNKQDYVEAVKAATGGAGADVILDMVGGDYVDRNYEAAAIEGRIVQIAFLNGPIAEVNFARLMMKRLTHTGSTLRPRTAEFKGEIAAALEAQVWPKIAAGEIRPVIDSTFTLAQAAEAHRRIDKHGHVGKIMMVVNPEIG